MKKDTLKVGTDKGEFAVIVDVEIPETHAEVMAIAKGNLEYAVAKFVRGYRIDLQEGGARQVVAEMLAGRNSQVMMKDKDFMARVKSAVEAEIAAFDPAKPRARATRAKPAPTVTIEQGKKYSAAELQDLLTKAGIKVVSE